MSEVRHGLRHFLSNHVLYDFFQTIIGANKWRRNFLKSFLLEKIPDNATILDLGCGTCEALSILPANVNYIGIDRNPLYISRAKQRYPNRKAVFFCEDLSTCLPKFTGKVDVVLMLGLLHHLNDAECDSIFSTVSHVLNPTGFILTLDPVYADNQGKIAKFIVSCDRGTAVRDMKGYKNLAQKYFDQVDAYLDLKPILIPYTGIAMRCALQTK